MSKERPDETHIKTMQMVAEVARSLFHYDEVKDRHYTYDRDGKKRYLSADNEVKLWALVKGVKP